jgi:hypothetical protein
MPVSLPRRALMILFAGAFLAATILQSSLAASAAAASDAAMVGHDRGDGDAMPCKTIPVNCLSGLGCIFMISLPAPQLTISADLAWSSVVYGARPVAPGGRSIKPDLGPPIRSA